jgi:hypothetical protein
MHQITQTRKAKWQAKEEKTKIFKKAKLQSEEKRKRSNAYPGN